MTRAEHLQWCKDRAREYLDAGNLRDALASFLSDMNKHQETATTMAAPVFVMLTGLAMRDVANRDERAVRRFIEGFN